MYWLDENKNRILIIKLQRKREKLIHDYFDGKVEFNSANRQLKDINQRIKTLYNDGVPDILAGFRYSRIIQLKAGGDRWKDTAKNLLEKWSLLLFHY